MTNSRSPIRLSAGDWVEVRSKEEVLATLDETGGVDGLPFMPEMLQFCGKRVQVSKRAHKTCDTVNKPAGRRLEGSVHLDNLRCDGSAHGGCQAGCLLFWKEAWLKPVSADPGASAQEARAERRPILSSYTEDDLSRDTRAADASLDDPAYSCQATRLPAATTPLGKWEIGQYIEDYTSGNVTFRRICASFVFTAYCWLIELGIGVGPLLRWLYERFQQLVGGPPYPLRTGRIPAGAPTPSATLNLQPGEWVRIKKYPEILETLDPSNKNRGLFFDCEGVPYCGGTYRVITRVSRTINEKTGKMIHLRNPSVILDGVTCGGRYGDGRLFCPRALYPMWREIWLERVESNE
jgi:hypothetical protein